MKEEPMERVWGRLPESYVELLRRKAERLGMSQSGYVSMCIRLGDNLFTKGNRVIFEEGETELENV